MPQKKKRSKIRRRRRRKATKKKCRVKEEDVSSCDFAQGVHSDYPESCCSAAHSGTPEKQGHRNMDLVNKPRCKSFVWSYFGLKADERGKPLNSREAICRLCRKIVLSKGGNTTNLRNHLRRRHRADVFETPSSTSSGALFETQGE